MDNKPLLSRDGSGELQDVGELNNQEENGLYSSTFLGSNKGNKMKKKRGGGKQR